MLAFLAFLMLQTSPLPAEIAGLWRTFDDKTGENKALVRIVIREGKLLGTVERVFPPAGVDPDPLCIKCKGDLKNRRVVGMRVLWGFEEDGGSWVGGRLLDPEAGKEYRGKIWLDDDGSLKVRGYSGIFFFRTQTWERAAQ